MKITYISHSGFLIEMEECYFIFDYYHGKLPELKKDKPVFVFASHNHPDHFNPKIFKLLSGQKRVVAVLSKDVYASRVPEGIEIFSVKPCMDYELPLCVKMHTLRSTDIGVAFLIKKEDKVIYHAGDLNDWVWKEDSIQNNKSMTGRYRKEIDSLIGETIDIAFLPLDPRQEEHYADGMLYFLKKINVKKVFPMHFWNKPQTVLRFLNENPHYDPIICKLTENGKNIQL